MEIKMKYLCGLIVVSLLTFTSCKKDEISSSIEGNGFKVEFLFEKDGIKVYRFTDGASYHYFTSRGETISSQQHGKTSYDENIN
jgi:hypothetical protein